MDVGMAMAELPEQGAHGIKIGRVEFPQLCVEQIVGEERAVFGAVSGRNIRIKTAPPLGFFAGHNCPTDRLGIVEDSGLDGFYRYYFLTRADRAQRKIIGGKQWALLPS